MIKYNNSNINDWYFYTSDIIKVYRNNSVCYRSVKNGGTPQYKLVAYYNDGTVYRVVYDGNDSLSQAEVRGHTTTYSLMTSFEIGDTVSSIGDNAFYGCDLISTISIPSGVTIIGQNAFGNCSNLTSITVDANNTYYDSRDNCNAIINTSINQLVQGCKNTTIPNTVKTIGIQAFNGCSSLTTITIPSGVTSVNSYAFQNCSSLANVHFQATTAPSIISTAFNGCIALSKIYIPTCDSADSYASKEGLSSYTNKIYAENNTQCTVTPSLSGQPFTIVAKAAGQFKFTSNSSAKFSKMQYSTNGGSSWSNYTSGSVKQLSSGGKLMFKFTQSGGTQGVGTISGSSNYEVEGNARSLWAGNNFSGNTTQAFNYQLYNLFTGQAKLLSAENLVLPSTTLRNYCYNRMFYNCTSLTAAPVLSATTLSNYCYREMFSGCTNLVKIDCYATNISAANCTTNWVSGVAASGTFTKALSMTGWSRGVNGIPSGWTVKNKT